MDRLKMAFDIAITGENSCNGKVHAPVSGEASFPLIINRGNRIENTHPLTKYELARLVRTVRGKPNPMKYGQFDSINVNRWCSSQPILIHLYSKEYKE